MRVIGTAGHVDHGKSTLVAALTGSHPDRLKEEQAREMTIDLGFAWLTLPDGQDVGIVDVPGHRDFIENMLAGVGGIDAVLFVIAADEGVMPQTREHLAILDILNIPIGVIALTKIDMVPEEDWLALVETDIRQVVKGTVLESAPIVRVSARNGTGIDDLKLVVSSALKDLPPRPDLGKPRLPVDRVFTVAGFGTVVTGTLTNGSFNIGEEVEVLPTGKRGRVRGLQTHRKKEQTAQPGSRVAMNINGLSTEDIRRGDVITLPASYPVSQRMDVVFKLLDDVDTPLTHNSQVKFFLAAAETMARVRVLGSDQINPGETGWLQLEFSEPMTGVRGDRYILRRPSPGETLGGGVILDPTPKWRHKRHDSAVLSRLKSLEQGTPAEVLEEALTAGGIAPLADIVSRSRLNAEQAQQALVELQASGMIVPLDEGAISLNSAVWVTSKQRWQAETARMESVLESFHQQYPLKRGIPREELKSRLKIAPKIFPLLIKRWADEAALVDGNAWISLPMHQVRFSGQQQKQIDNMRQLFAASPYAPPSVKECQAFVGEDVYIALIEQGELVQVSAEVVFWKHDYQHMLDWVEEHLRQAGTLTAAEFRDAFNTSRKFALALLEHLDGIGITIREGDNRRLRK